MVDLAWGDEWVEQCIREDLWTAWCFVDRGESLVSGCLSCAAVLLLDLVRGAVAQGGWSRL